MTQYAFLDPSEMNSGWGVISKQIIALYRSNEWWGADPEDPELVRRIVAGSHCFMTAEENGRVIGMGRAISDRASDAYIQDVTVSLEYRGQGIGMGLIRRIMARLAVDGIQWVGLIAERDSHPFYERLGFHQMTGAIPMIKVGP